MRTALVTGANRGIGLAIARGLAVEHRMTVLLGSRHLADGQRAASSIEGRVAAVELNLSDPVLLAEQYDSIVDACGAIDVLINNAGVYKKGGIQTVSGEEFQESVRIHLLAPYELIRRTLPGMIQHDYGRIVNVSAGGGLFSEGLDGPIAYVVSKAGLNALTLSASKDLPANIKINAMCPGWVRTRMGGQAASLSVEEGASTALWLATLPSDGPTGQFFRRDESVTW